MAEYMHAVDIQNGSGLATALFINAQTPRPIPASGQCLVKIRAFGLNRMDLSQREGKYPVPPQAGKILGVEFSGVIVQMNEQNASEFKEGDAVFGLAYGGAYAEYIAVSLKMCIRKPKELSWEICAGIPETWMTAIQALFTIAEFTEGKSVLWHAGGSSVSMCGIQLSLNAGASQVFVTAGTQDKINFCTDVLGATAAYNYKTQDWAQEIKASTNNTGVDIIIDFIGQNYFQSNLDVAAKDGRIVNLALLSGGKLSAGVDISPFLRKRVRYEGSSLRSQGIDYQSKLKARLESEILPLIVAGKFVVSIEKVLKWEHIVEAHQLMESNQTKGKIICTIE